MGGELGGTEHPGFDRANYTDPDSGRYTKSFPAGVVHFDGFSGNGLQLVTKTPVIGDDGRSLSLMITRSSIGSSYSGWACPLMWWREGPPGSRVPGEPRRCSSRRSR